MNAVFELLDRAVLEVAPLLLGWRVRTEVDESHRTRVDRGRGLCRCRRPGEPRLPWADQAQPIDVPRERGRSMCTARTGSTGAPTSSQGHQVRARRCCCGAVSHRGRRRDDSPRGRTHGDRAGQPVHALAIDAGHDGTSVLRGPVLLSPVPPPGVLATLGSGSLSPPTILGGSSPPRT